MIAKKARFLSKYGPTTNYQTYICFKGNQFEILNKMSKKEENNE